MIGHEQPDVIIGRVVAAFGIKGEVKVKVETDFPERFEDLDQIWLKTASGEGHVVGVKSVRFHQGIALIKFEGCDDRNGAEDLQGAELLIAKSERKKLNRDQFYLDDIIGMDVYTTSGDHLGQVTEVLKGAANDVYITPCAMIPAVKQIVREMDMARRKMIIEPIEGMIEESRK